MLSPLPEKILVLRRVIPEEEETKGGIVLVHKPKEKCVDGTVLAVGEKVTVVKVGDHVYFKKFGGEEIVSDDKTYMVFDEDDILAKE